MKQSTKIGEFRCTKCFPNARTFSPILQPSGYSYNSRRDLVCPICNTYYDSRTGEIFDEEEYKKKEEENRYMKEYNERWFK